MIEPIIFEYVTALNYDEWLQYQCNRHNEKTGNSFKNDDAYIDDCAIELILLIRDINVVNQDEVEDVIIEAIVLIFEIFSATNTKSNPMYIDTYRMATSPFYDTNIVKTHLFNAASSLFDEKDKLKKHLSVLVAQLILLYNKHYKIKTLDSKIDLFIANKGK